MKESIKKQSNIRNKSELLIAAVLIVLLSTSIRVYAGDINDNEQAVLSAAQGPFVYNGKTYVANPTYLGMLQAKLSEDGVNLDSSKASLAIEKINSSIAEGVANGYIVESIAEDDTSEGEKVEESTSEALNIIEEIVDIDEENEGTTFVDEETTYISEKNSESIDNLGSNLETVSNEKNEINTSSNEELNDIEGKSNQTETTKVDLSRITTKQKNNKFFIGAVFLCVGALIVVLAVKYSKYKK